MRAVVQRVRRASVRIDGSESASIDRGLFVLLGLRAGDTAADLDWMAGKVSRLRVFEDADGKMNLSVGDVGGALAVVSQFTLYGDARRGNRPSYTEAMAVDDARAFWPAVEARFAATGVPCAFGRFQAMMDCELVNDGPVTLWLDSGER